LGAICGRGGRQGNPLHGRVVDTELRELARDTGFAGQLVATAHFPHSAGVARSLALRDSPALPSRAIRVVTGRLWLEVHLWRSVQGGGSFTVDCSSFLGSRTGSDHEVWCRGPRTRGSPTSNTNPAQCWHTMANQQQLWGKRGKMYVTRSVIDPPRNRVFILDGDTCSTKAAAKRKG